jgi:hypothetical protein
MITLPIRIVTYSDGSVLCVYADGAAAPFESNMAAFEAHGPTGQVGEFAAWCAIERQQMTMAQMYGREKQEAK